MPRKQPREHEHEQCFYCNGLVAGDGEGDHFPIPRNCGGTATVPCCTSCHDMKDRFNIDNWPTEWLGVVLQDFPKLSRETRIFLAKSIRTTVEATKLLKERAPRK